VEASVNAEIGGCVAEAVKLEEVREIRDSSL